MTQSYTIGIRKREDRARHNTDHRAGGLHRCLNSTFCAIAAGPAPTVLLIEN